MKTEIITCDICKKQITLDDALYIINETVEDRSS